MHINDFLERVLLWVKTPSQYVGGEWNSVRKDLASVRTSLCLSYPDIYSVGMSYHGIKLLYQLVNDCEDLACERSFAPLPDFIACLQKYEIPLFSLETRTPVRQFDFWGFSIAVETSWPTVLRMLELARIPIYARERSEDDPIIIAGGHGVYNPEPAAEFLDIVTIGDGEILLPAMLRYDADLRERKVPREQRIIEMCRSLPGLYAPNFYQVHYHNDGTIAEITPQHGLPDRIKACYVENLDTVSATRPIVAYSNTIHNRMFLEIMRGCTRGCRFCQAGMIRRPLRIRSVDSLVADAVELFKNTGYEEICLYSLASSDYPYLPELTRRLTEIFAPHGVGIALPSLRVNEQLRILPAIVASVRKRTLTLAPEVGSEKMQAVINKPISDQEMVAALTEAYQSGWDAIKLYFMIGLPFQDEQDYSAIIDTMHRVSYLRKQLKGYSARVTATVSNFVCKPHTPLQWAPMTDSETLREVQRRMKEAIRSPKIKVNFHDVFLSSLEGIIARGDRKVTPVLVSAWRQGAYLDNWHEYFRREIWEQALKDAAIDPAHYLYRQIPQEEKLPWHHLDCGVSPDYLWQEWQRAQSGEITPDCAENKCNRCGIDVRYCYRPER